MIHRSTYLNPSLHTQNHTQINTNHQNINKATHTHKHKPSTEPHTHKPSNQFEPTTATTPTTQATNQKPTPPIWNPGHWKYPKIITEVTIGATNDQPKRSTHRSTDPSFQTHRSTDPNPPSTDPSPMIQTQLVDPRWSNLQPQKSKTQHRCNEREVVRWEMRERPCEMGEKFRRWSFREERANGKTEKEEREENSKDEKDEREISGEIGGVKYLFFLQYCEQCNSMFRIVL